MTRQHRLPREYDPDATVDAGKLELIRPGDVPTSAGEPMRPRCRKGILGHETPQLTEDTRSLLRIRLRAAALVALTGFGLFLIWRLMPYAHRLTDELLLPMHIFTVVVVAVCATAVWRPREMCVYSLRLVEALLFGVPAVFFLLLTADEILYACSQNVAYAPDPIESWIILAFTYSLFIPNGWRRAAIVNGVLCALPIATLLVLLWTNAEVRKAYSAAHIVPICLSMFVTFIAATLGAHLIHSLRCEAFEYRRLGQYRLGKKLGSGGMGDVYLAEHEMLKRPCAIKVIRPGNALDPKALARFEREVKSMAQLSHWNTVEIYDYGREADGTFYYVMEYLPGLNLHDLVDKHGALPPGRVIHLLRQVCDALSEAHANDMLHRDIKPGNVFAAYRGGVCDVAKLLDFGLVKPVTEGNSSRLTQDGAIAGTPQFMSPEQANQSPLDARSDIYCLGAVGYFLLTGRPPFDDTRPLAVLISHARDPVTAPSQLRPDIPDDLERVILKCLAKDPAERYQSAEALRKALDACRDAGTWTAEDARRWWKENEGMIGPKMDGEPARSTTAGAAVSSIAVS